MRDAPKTPATIVGPYGRAWKFDDDASKVPGTSVAYLIERPGAHPMWDGWVLSVISLADFPGVPSAKKLYPEAEYELLILALNPDYPAPTLDGKTRPFHHLEPVDIVEQFHGLDQAQAVELAERAVRAIVAGVLLAGPGRAG